MTVTKSCLNDIAKLPGFIGVALMDLKSCMILSIMGNNQNLDIDAAMHADFLKNRLKIIQINNKHDIIEDMIINQGKSFHIVRHISGINGTESAMLYVVMDRSRGNLALTRMKMTQMEPELIA
jgi:predicted regulator of Ras-like GTPase activity (Roadblock/LC7/MglB family)